MSTPFYMVLERLKGAASSELKPRWPMQLHPDNPYTIVLKRDLKDLLDDYDRIDSKLRGCLP